MKHICCRLTACRLVGPWKSYSIGKITTKTQKCVCKKLEMSSEKKRNYSCTVPNCSTKTNEGFSRPTAKNRQAWIDKLGLDPNIKVHRICRLHFEKSDIGTGGEKRSKILKGKTPTLNLPVRKRKSVCIKNVHTPKAFFKAKSPRFKLVSRFLMSWTVLVWTKITFKVLDTSMRILALLKSARILTLVLVNVKIMFMCQGPEPNTRYGDWERKGRVTDF